MKAVLIYEYGGLDVLKCEDIPCPEPGQGEVLIKVHAAGVNPSDAMIREGKAFAEMITDPFPYTPGWDVSGVVVETGDDGGGFKPGDAVYGLVNFPYGGGAYAEYVKAPACQLAKKPALLDHIQSASLPLVSLTAWQALFEAAELKKDERILIHAAAGGVGHIAVQLARWKGAALISATGAPRDEDYLTSIGVDEFIDFRSQRFEEVVHDMDVVLDCVGGETQQRSWQVLKKGGRLVTIMEPPPEGRAEEYCVRAERVFVRPDACALEEIRRCVDNGIIVPFVFSVFPLEMVEEAHELVEMGQARGKIVLNIEC